MHGPSWTWIRLSVVAVALGAALAAPAWAATPDACVRSRTICVCRQQVDVAVM